MSSHTPFSSPTLLSSPSPSSAAFYLVANFLSIIGCLILFYLASRSPGRIALAIKLIILLSLSHFVGSAINIAEYYTSVNNTTCAALSMLKVFTIYTEFFWTCLMALFVFFLLGRPLRKNLTRDIQRLIYLCTILSFLCTIVPLIGIADLQYVNEEGYCGLIYAGEKTFSRNLLIFFLTYGVIFILVLSLTIAACIRGVLFFKNLNEGLATVYDFDGRSLLLYPVSQVIIYTPSAIYKLVDVWTDHMDDEISTWELVVAGLYNLGGFLNLIVYGLQFVKAQRKRKREISETQLQTLNEKSIDGL